MNISKAWDWRKETDTMWLRPSEECYAVGAKWKQKKYTEVLDFGCGLGRHAIFFAKQGFRVSAFDLSEDGTSHLKVWADEEQLDIDIRTADMLDLPYLDNSFDAVFAYHVISHTNTEGIQQIFREIQRVLRPNGEIYLTLCSKDTWSFKDSGYPKQDGNTVIKTDDGPEQGIPHFYATLDDTLEILKDFTIQTIRHTDDCYFAGKKQDSKHYFISAVLPKT